MSKPPIAHLIPTAFNKEIEIRKVVRTFLISKLNPEGRIKLCNNLIIPIVLECHYGLHPFSLTCPQCLCHLGITNGFATIPVNITLMEDWLVLLGKNHRIIEINMLEGPEMITIDPDIMNSECRILEAHVLKKGRPSAGSEINDLLIGGTMGLRSVKH